MKLEWKLAKDLTRGDYILDPGTGLPAEVWEVQLDATLNGAWILYGRVQPKGRIALTVPQDTQVYLYHPVRRTEPAPPDKPWHPSMVQPAPAPPPAVINRRPCGPGTPQPDPVWFEEEPEDWMADL